MDDFLQETAVKPELTTKWLGQNYIYFQAVDSTNDLLKDWVAAGNGQTPPAGMVILTDYQRRGRGRLDRKWEAPPGSSLLLSVLFRPLWPAEKCSWLTMIASLAIVKTIARHTALMAKIKWPNDVVVRVGQTWCKLAGLLLETNLDDNGRCLSAILGMGININIPADQLPASPTPPTSLLSATGNPVLRRPFLLDLLFRLEEYYDAANKGLSPQSTWQKELITLGQAVMVTNTGNGQTLSGTAVATGEWGQLIVKGGEGREHTILAGDVTLRQQPFDNSED
jgi:BirA family biotin operon repressor/biotin-[acetyl-CoA-carboxylase] ligase